MGASEQSKTSFQLWIVILSSVLGGYLWTLQSPGMAGTGLGACPQRPALKRFKSHRVQPGETLAKIASRYGLMRETLMGMNPAVRTGRVTLGQSLQIPPYNGIVVATSGRTLKSIAQLYRVKPDVLFEVNGCEVSPKMVFVPGVNWSPINGTVSVAAQPSPAAIDKIAAELRQDRYPLPQSAPLLRPYGWHPNGPNRTIVFSGGVDLAAAPGTPVYAVASGIVAFAGTQNPWDSTIVINHARGRQTRYGYLSGLKVKVGQRVRRGQAIGLVNGNRSALHFELRSRSTLGWVAQDPQPYLQEIAPKAKGQV
jgi:murein DD-endopeptidase MepM/ murein hydrolase activator NlpD